MYRPDINRYRQSYDILITFGTIHKLDTQLLLDIVINIDTINVAKRLKINTTIRLLLSL